MIIVEPERLVLNQMIYVTIAGRLVTGRMSAESPSNLRDNTIKIREGAMPAGREDT